MKKDPGFHPGSRAAFSKSDGRAQGRRGSDPGLNGPVEAAERQHHGYAKTRDAELRDLIQTFPT
jgi:hypothetical protein